MPLLQGAHMSIYSRIRLGPQVHEEWRALLVHAQPAMSTEECAMFRYMARNCETPVKKKVEQLLRVLQSAVVSNVPGLSEECVLVRGAAAPRLQLSCGMIVSFACGGELVHNVPGQPKNYLLMSGSCNTKQGTVGPVQGVPCSYVLWCRDQHFALPVARAGHNQLARVARQLCHQESARARLTVAHPRAEEVEAGARHAGRAHAVGPGQLLAGAAGETQAESNDYH